MSGLMSDPSESYQEPESDGSLEYWMWCEEQELELVNELEILARAGAHCSGTARLYGTTKKEGRTYIIMKRYEGSLNGRTFDTATALEVFQQIAAALADLHEHHIIHQQYD